MKNHTITLRYVLMTKKDSRNCDPVYTCCWDTLWDVLVEIKCADNPCQHGGSCENKTLGFKCECPFIYEGDTCEKGRSVYIHYFRCDAMRVFPVETLSKVAVCLNCTVS